MSAGVYDIQIEQGTSFAMDVTYTTASGIPMDITTYSGRGQIRATAVAPDVLVPLTVDMSATVSGLLTISLTADQTSAIPTRGKTYKDVQKYVYDVELYNVSKVIRLLNGACIVSPEVTK